MAHLLQPFLDAYHSLEEFERSTDGDLHRLFPHSLQQHYPLQLLMTSWCVRSCAGRHANDGRFGSAHYISPLIKRFFPEVRHVLPVDLLAAGIPLGSCRPDAYAKPLSACR
jgi:hypothetical protein